MLKERQSDMVSWALRVDREEPVSSLHEGPEAPGPMGAEEQRLEATLTALKQQLVGGHLHHTQPCRYNYFLCVISSPVRTVTCGPCIKVLKTELTLLIS